MVRVCSGCYDIHYCLKGGETWALLREGENSVYWTTEGRLIYFFRLKSSLLLSMCFIGRSEDLLSFYHAAGLRSVLGEFWIYPYIGCLISWWAKDLGCISLREAIRASWIQRLYPLVPNLRDWQGWLLKAVPALDHTLYWSPGSVLIMGTKLLSDLAKSCHNSLWLYVLIA